MIKIIYIQSNSEHAQLCASLKEKLSLEFKSSQIVIEESPSEKIGALTPLLVFSKPNKNKSKPVSVYTKFNVTLSNIDEVIAAHKEYSDETPKYLGTENITLLQSKTEKKEPDFQIDPQHKSNSVVELLNNLLKNSYGYSETENFEDKNSHLTKYFGI